MDLAGDTFEIVSSDSVQVYRYLDIGSGKPDKEARAAVRHHLIDIVDPEYPFTAGEFCKRAMLASEEIESRNRIPFFVGGTGLYIDSFFQGISEIPVIDPAIKSEVNRAAEERGLQSLYSELVDVDPVFADRIHPNDKQRILRGLEVFKATGRRLSDYFESKKRHQSEKTLFVGLYLEREELRLRIDKRVDKMIADGLIDEVEKLRKAGYGPHLNSMRSIGYHEVNEYLDGRLSKQEAVEKIKLHTKRYAKRQMTWFRKNKSIHWHTPFRGRDLREHIARWLDSVAGA